MKKLYFIPVVLIVAGCASASPIDILIPTPSVPVTDEYLGHTKPPKANGMYHSLADTKNEKALLDVRKVELDAMYHIADKSNGLVIDTMEPISNGLWAVIVAGLASIGVVIPSPFEKKRVMKAGLQDPDEFKKSI